MVRREFSFPSADGKTAVHAAEWVPETPVRGVVLLSHGVSEYILRYEPLAEALTARGFAAAGHDHLGHGGSVVPGAPRLYFGPRGSWDTVVRDLYARRRLIGQRFPGVPVFLLGHSMGSFLARTYLIQYPGTVSGAILMGTGQLSPAMLSAGRAVTAGEIRRLGETAASPVVDRLAFAAYNKRFAPNRTGFDWLSRSREDVDRYVQDPLCGGSPTAGLFREMLSGMDFIARPRNLRGMNLDTPVCFLSGAMDPVGGCGRGVARAFRAFRRAGARDVSMKLYPGARHELLHEDCRREVCEDILRWLEAHLPKEDIKSP